VPRTRHLQILTTSSSFVSHAVAVTGREVTEPRPNEGVWGNERLTAVTGAVLFVLLAVEGITILFLRPLLIVHMFVGMALIAPAALKIGSTGYRFARYYTGAPAYRRKGARHLVQRALRRIVVVAAIGAGLLLGAVTLPLAHPWVHESATSPGED